MNINLFTGSGIHFENDIPGVGRLTEEVLDGEWFRNSDGRYFPIEDIGGPLAELNKVDPHQDFLKLLKELNDRYLFDGYPRIESNYEDLYFLVEQINKVENGSIDSLPVSRFINDIIQHTFSFRKDASLTNELTSLSQFTHNTLNFLEHAVRYQLLGYKPVGLELISQIVNQEELNKLNILSLNHDDLFEKHLNDLGSDFFDGFDEVDGEVIWYNDSFGYKETKIRLFKLHGSVDWYYATNENTGRTGYAKLTGDDIWHIEDADGNWVRPNMTQGHFLSGYGKDKNYHFGIYADLHNALYNELKSSNHILMSGYGWGDKIINGKLQDWTYQTVENTITIIHPNKENLLEESLKKTSSLASLNRNNKINFVEKGFEESRFEDIEEYLN
ncbi:hypothetical protein CK503_04175 [Aliifodinibius salipaludis]|uniref:Uncharacterized protein n=1 Tax=Fodinibius salipaludis TaxID=2032627 RepID=A0A2A2GDX8_9BACT|nr:SIR2 family protein [Aliifodinibius salipaludis]PAU95400.1 hypothetical protein CK503_04175 [Aliifodinibius salipaludis]